MIPASWPANLGPVICVVGARPNFMKMAPILRAFSVNTPSIPTLLVHTGQHYDKDMNDRLFEDLRLPRPDINLEVDIDGQPAFRTVMHPTGVYKDGVSTVYKRFEVKAGSHQVAVRMNDNLVKPGFNFVKEEQVTLKPGQVMVIDFNPDRGGLFFK